jgi:phage tail sheath protein FI
MRSFVDDSEQLNKLPVIFGGKLIARVALATNKPAEFIILRINRDTRPSRPSWLRRSVTRS